MYYIDWTYIVFVIPMLLLSMIASAGVNRAFSKYSRVLSRRGISGADAARRVLSANGVAGVSVERVSGKLTDHYDPRTNTIRLSEDVYSSTSVAAIGVASHEAGHAVQYALGYSPAKLRSAIVPVTNIGSHLAMILILVGLVLSYMGQIFVYIAYAGVACFSLCVVFQLLTLFTEFDASRRAMTAIEDAGILDSDEITGAGKVLRAAAMTYVAALAAAVSQLLRLLVIVGGRQRRD